MTEWPRVIVIGQYLQHVRSSSVQPQYRLKEINAAKSSEISRDCGIQS